MIVQPAKLRKGAGHGSPQDGFCLMQMVDWFDGQDVAADAPMCACPVLTVLGVWLNDRAPSQAHLDSLWPLVWRLLNSRDKRFERRRAEYIVREVTIRLVAPVFEEKWPEHAAALRQARSMDKIEATAEAARAAAWAAQATEAA